MKFNMFNVWACSIVESNFETRQSSENTLMMLETFRPETQFTAMLYAIPYNTSITSKQLKPILVLQMQVFLDYVDLMQP